MANDSPAHSTRQLAVLGSPIAHSQSPALHAAAYRALGFPWNYQAVEVRAGELEPFVSDLGEDWRGLSLTMPLKHEILPLIDDLDEVARLTGAVNTVLVTANPEGRTLAGFNTDVTGLVRALAEGGVTEARNVVILGAGATASSALVAAAELGAESVELLVRSRVKAAPLVELGRTLGLTITVTEFADVPALTFVPAAPTQLVISTLPGGTALQIGFAQELRRDAVLFDVAYAPWPSVLAAQWAEAGGTALSGLTMLLHQALIQVRIFVTGDPFEPLAGEDAVLAEMRAALTH